MDILISGAVHRSGSTLVQRIFNAREKTLIWGEQGGCLTNFLDIKQKLIFYTETFGWHREDFFGRENSPDTWTACMTPERVYLDNAITDTVKYFFHKYYSQYRDDHDRIGFKEVRYGQEEIALFRECYPDALVILLTRHPVDVWKSANGTHWYLEEVGGVEQFVKQWKDYTEYYIQAAQSFHNMHFIRYEDILTCNHTQEMLCNLAQISKEKFDRILSNKLYSSSVEIKESEHRYILDYCSETMIAAGYPAEETLYVQTS